MDGVLANFNKAVVEGGDEHELGFFENLEPMRDAIESAKKLTERYNVYLLSTASWGNPNSWGEKRIWVEKHFGDLLKKKLILTHNKSLLRGVALIDDHTWNGADGFQGDFIHFGTEKYPDWASVLKHLLPAYTITKMEYATKPIKGKGLGALFSKEDLNGTTNEHKTIPMEEVKSTDKPYGEKIKELKDLIRTSLDLCDEYQTPKVCQMKADGDSYKLLEENIIDRVVKGGHSISDAILQIEKENNPNIIQD